MAALHPAPLEVAPLGLTATAITTLEPLVVRETLGLVVQAEPGQVTAFLMLLVVVVVVPVDWEALRAAVRVRMALVALGGKMLSMASFACLRVRKGKSRSRVSATAAARSVLHEHIRSLHYLEIRTMAVTTTIHIVAGGSTADIVIQDQLGNNLTTSQTAWIVQPAASTGVTITAQPDGITWRFAAAVTSPAPNTVTAQAVYTPTSGPSGPVLSIVVAAPPVVVTAIQYNETAGT